MYGLQRKMFIGGNWKCNGTTEFVKEYTNHLLNDLNWDQDKIDVMVFPGALHLTLVNAKVKDSI